MRRSIALTAIAAACLGGFVAAPALAQPNDSCLDTGVTPLIDNGIGGTANLCAGDGRVHAEMATERLISGNAYTIWFVYFDQPGTCKASPCVGADALGDDPPGVFSRLDAVVADQTGTAQFSGDLRDLRLSHGSVVWLLMFGHGPANQSDNRALARQLLTPQSPQLGAPAAGAASDGEIGAGVARAVFTIP